MKHLLFALLRFVVVFLESSIVFFALLVLIAHLLTPYFHRYRQVIERFASNLIHKPVQISLFSVAWQGLEPTLKGKQVVIWNDSLDRPLFKIKEFDIGINLFQTILTGNIALGEVKLRGLDLDIHQTKNNQVVLSGMSPLFSQNSNNSWNDVLSWLLTQPKISLSDIHVAYTPFIGSKWPEMQLKTRLKNQLNHHQLSLELKFLEKKSSQLSLVVDATASLIQHLSPANLKGHIYIEGHSVQLDRWLVLFRKNCSIKNGIANFKIWTDWQQKHLIDLNASITSAENSVLQIGKQPLITLMPFSANLKWQKKNTTWVFDSVVRNLGFSPWKQIPGVKGLSAFAHITPTSGNIIARSKDLELDFVKLFKVPIHLDWLSSELSWQRKEDAFSIQVRKFGAANDDLALNGQMALLIPSNIKNSQISLLAHVKTEHPTNIGNYLPLPLLNAELVKWLSNAITKGTGKSTVLLEGPITKFPFDKNEGSFAINTEIKNGELHYQPAWPSLQNINGDLNFSGRQMQMLVSSAQTFGVTLKNIQVDIPLIKTHVQAVLHVVIDSIHTRLESGLAFLKATPIIKKIGQFSDLALSGPLDLSFKLLIPLELGKEKLKVKGIGKTQNAKVLIPLHNIEIDNLKGQFSLSQIGVEAPNLIGLLWNKPIVIDLSSTPSVKLTINYEDIQAFLNPEKNGWHFLLNTKNAQGSVLIPNNKEEAIEANFTTIHLNTITPTQNHWNLKEIPKVNLHADEVNYNQIKFGTVELKLRPILAGVAIKELQAGNRSYHLIAGGTWDRQGSKLSKFTGQLDSGDLSGFLRSWGLPGSITAEQTHLRFKLQWAGAPYDVSISKLRGNFSFNATNGQILDVGSNAEAKLGFGRLLTFLSLQSLGRRLQLDFSDLKAKGFNYTNLQGNFALRNGNAFTRNVVIEGPVATIAIKGRIGLNAKDYDLIIKVVPHFTSSLPVIVGLAGGPIAGAVTWLANAILGSTVQKIAETSFQITGTWGEPEVMKTSISPITSD